MTDARTTSRKARPRSYSNQAPTSSAESILNANPAPAVSPRPENKLPTSRQAELDAIYQEVLAHDQQLVEAAKSIPAGLPPDLYLDELIDRTFQVKRKQQ